MENEVSGQVEQSGGDVSFLAGQDGKFAPNWYEKAPEGYSVPEGLRTAPDFWSMVKMTENAQRKLGYPAESLLVKPSKDWKEEQWGEFFDKAGRPKSPDEYPLQVPDNYDKNMVDEFKTIAHKAGLLPNQVSAVMSFYQKIAGDAETAMGQQNAAQMEQAQAELKTEWGNGYEANLDRAKRYVMTFADDNDKEQLSGRLGNDPALLRVLANASKVMREDALLGANPDSDPNASSAAEELGKIQTNPIYYDPAQARAFKQEHDRLVQRAYFLRKQMQ